MFSQANDKRPIICEVCSVECANGNMYADHLRGKRHRYAASSGRATNTSVAQVGFNSRVQYASQATLIMRAFSRPVNPFSVNRATTLRLEQQLEKAAQPEPKDSRRGGNSSAASASSPATTSTLAKGANSDDAGKGRRASCSDANLQSRSSQRRRDFNQLPRGGEVRSMRQTLEDQQRAATVFMADQGQVRLCSNVSRFGWCSHVRRKSLLCVWLLPRKKIVPRTCHDRNRVLFIKTKRR